MPAQEGHEAELALPASIDEDESLAILDDLVVTRHLLESDMAIPAAQLATDEVVDRVRAPVDRMNEQIGAHDPSGAAEAMFTHLREAWLVRRNAPGDPVRLNR